MKKEALLGFVKNFYIFKMKKLKQLIKEKARLLFGVEKEVVSESDLFHSEVMSIVDKYYKGDATVFTEVRHRYYNHSNETEKVFYACILDSKGVFFREENENKINLFLKLTVLLMKK